MSEILEVDLLAFERGSSAQRKAVVDGVTRSLVTGFVYTRHDLSDDMLDTTYALLREFFERSAEEKQQFVAPESHGQTGYTGLLVETAAGSEHADWKEMLAWGPTVPEAHPLRRRHPLNYRDQVLPEEVVPGITAVLTVFRDSILDLQRRFLRIIAVGLGAHELLFDDLLRDGPHLTRAMRYPAMGEAPGPHEWAGEHADICLLTALPRATAAGLEVRTDAGWVDAAAPEGTVIMNSGLMLERMSNGIIPPGIHRVIGGPDAGERHSVVQFCHPTPWTVLAPLPSCCTPEHPPRFAGIEAGAMLDEVLWQINLIAE